MTDILEKHIFVGIIDLNLSLSLIQRSTKLYLVNHAALSYARLSSPQSFECEITYSTLSEELFYQLGLRQFGNFNKLKLEPPPPIRSLIRLAVQAEESVKASGLGLDEEQLVEVSPASASHGRR